MPRRQPSDTMNALELQSARQRAGLTQAELAAAVGCTASHVRALEMGRAEMGTDLCTRIRRVLQGSKGSLNPPPFGQAILSQLDGS